MRKLTLFWLFTFIMCVVPATVSAQLSAFQGDWANTDAATGGVTRIQISSGTPLRVHVWGQCHPTDCDMGTVDGYAYGPNVSSNLNTSAQAISATFSTGFSEAIVIIRLASRGRLQAEVYSRFTDSTGRTAYTTTDFFVQRRRPGRPGAPGGPGGGSARQDCLPYNPNNLRIENDGARGWLLTDGVSRMLLLDNRADAVRALALAKRPHCSLLHRPE